MRIALLALFMACVANAQAQGFEDLFAGGLDRWEALGDGHWDLRSDGVLVAYRDPKIPAIDSASEVPAGRQIQGWRVTQAWLYTKKEYTNFDLRLEFWLKTPGNSGIALRDPTRGAAGMTAPPDFSKTPSKVAYEIQLQSDWPDRWASGSIYGLANASPDVMRKGEWNTLHIEARADAIRVRLNGVLVAEHPCPPDRPKSGPIGLQLHDQFSLVMFRNVLLRETP